MSAIQAKNAVSKIALENLCAIENPFMQQPQLDHFPHGFAKFVQELVQTLSFLLVSLDSETFLFDFLIFFRTIMKAFEKVPDVDLDNKSNVLAGIIQTINMDLDTAKVVVLSTGTKNIDADALYDENRSILPDTHAEVVSRRCLMFYFYEQLKVLVNPSTASRSIFKYSTYGPIIKLKENIRFHLYVSKGPCGDATTFGKGTRGNTSATFPDR